MGDGHESKNRLKCELLCNNSCEQTHINNCCKIGQPDDADAEVCKNHAFKTACVKAVGQKVEQGIHFCFFE